MACLQIETCSSWALVFSVANLGTYANLVLRSLVQLTSEDNMYFMTLSMFSYSGIHITN